MTSSRHGNISLIIGSYRHCRVHVGVNGKVQCSAASEIGRKSICRKLLGVSNIQCLQYTAGIKN